MRIEKEITYRVEFSERDIFILKSILRRISNQGLQQVERIELEWIDCLEDALDA